MLLLEIAILLWVIAELTWMLTTAEYGLDRPKETTRWYMFEVCYIGIAVLIGTDITSRTSDNQRIVLLGGCIVWGWAHRYLASYVCQQCIHREK